MPEAKHGKLCGSFRLVLPLKRKGRGDALSCRFHFMACDPLSCLPPMSVRLTGELRPLRVLVVVDAEDARNASPTSSATPG